MPANHHPCLLWDGFLSKPFTCRTASATLQHVSNISRVFSLFVLCVTESVVLTLCFYIHVCLICVNSFGPKKGDYAVFQVFFIP